MRMVKTIKLHHLDNIEISVVRSYDPQMSRATQERIAQIPQVAGNPFYTHQFSMGDGDIIFDQSFHGLTQLYDPTADVIAIAGLGGHAYGFWSGGSPKPL